MAVSLTYQDIRQIAASFDQRHGVIPLQETDYVPIRFMAAKMEAATVEEYVREHHLRHNPSVAAMLDFYRGTSALEGRVVVRELNPASKTILSSLGQKPQEASQEYFKTLLDFVFEEYFAHLTPSQRLEIARKLEGLPSLIVQLEAIAQLPNLEEKIKRLDEVQSQNLSDYVECHLRFHAFLLHKHDVRELSDKESWQGCTKRFSLIQNVDVRWGVSGLVVMAAMIGVMGAKQRGDIARIGMAASAALLMALLFYELLVTPVAGAALYAYRRYFTLKSPDERELHQKVNQLIAQNIEKVIQRDPSPALVEKWRNCAIELICPAQMKEAK